MLNWKKVGIGIVAGLFSIYLRSYLISRRHGSPFSYLNSVISKFNHEKDCSWSSPFPRDIVDSWYSMKEYPRAATCRINGLMIEELDPEFNFRRSYNLGFDKNSHHQHHLIPFFRAYQDSTLQERKRRVLLNFGGKSFDSSIGWLMRFYPVDFTEIHLFSVRRVAIPGHHSKKDKWLYRRNRFRQLRSPLPIPNWALDRIRGYIPKKDGKWGNLNTKKFIKSELNLTAGDTLIVKMDIESAEWKVLTEWMLDPDMPYIVDELFVEVHYDHPSISWSSNVKFKHSREEATKLLSDLRDHGFFVHPCP